MEHTETILEQHHRQMFEIYKEMSEELKDQMQNEISPNAITIKTKITHGKSRLNMVLDSWNFYMKTETTLEYLKFHLQECLKDLNAAEQIPINTSTIEANNNAMKKMAAQIKTS